MSPLSVAGAESWRYFWTARTVKPGHVENCLLLISFSSFCLGGLNAAWWRYLMSAAFDVMAYDLFQPKTDLFPTCALISVHFKTVRYFSQYIFSLFSY